MKPATRKKRSKAERLLDAARRSPSPKINDPRQLDLIEDLNETLEIKFLKGFAEKRKCQGFAKLDEAITTALKKGEAP